mmetsp:Transcript_17701/g.47072  ORF Transcript_17701/g.47072 Transcript_17701/m.47072 type:complete len:82 (-) Transcript_17701:5703-5948(-)
MLEGVRFHKKAKRTPVVIPNFEARWGPDQQEAFEILRERLVSPEVLVPPRAGARRRLYADAGDVGLGAALLQLEPSPDREV